MRNPSGMRAMGGFGVAVLAWLLLALCCVVPAAMADQLIPAGGQVFVNSGLIDLACTDLTVAGVLDTGTGTYLNVRNVTVGPSGIIQGAGTINYSGAVSSSGTIQPSVRLLVNPPSNLACPGPLNQIPTLGNSMLLALTLLLLGLAGLAMREQRALGCRESKGVGE